MTRFLIPIVVRCSVLAVLLSLPCTAVEAQFGGRSRDGGSRDGGGRDSGRGPGGGFGGGGFNMMGQGSGLTRVLSWDGLGTELKLSEEQQGQVQEIVQQATPPQEEMFRAFSQMRDASEEERAAMQQTFQQEAQKRIQNVESQLKQVLSTEQYDRLQQVSRQQSGNRALLEESNAAQLKLTDEQKTRITEVISQADANRGEMFRMSDEDREIRRREIEQAVQAVLTEEQRQDWQKLLGSPAAGLESLRFGGGSRRGFDRGGSDRGGSSSSTTTTPSADTMSAVPSTAPASTSAAPGEADDLSDLLNLVDSLPEPVPAGPAVIDFGAGQLAETTAGPDGAQTVSFNFQNAPWSEVLKLFARISGLTLDMTSSPSGTFTYYDKQQHTPEQALDVLNGYLLQRGYLLVRRDQFLIVANISQGIPPNLVPTVEVSELSSRARNELVRTVFELDQLRAADLVNDIKSLLGPQGSVTAMGTTNRLVVTGLAQDLVRVQNLLDGSSLTAGPNDFAFRSFRLQHIPAADAEPTIKALLGISSSFGGGTAGSGRSRSGSQDPRAMFMEMMQQRMRGGDNRGGDNRGGAPSSPDSSAGEARVTVDERTNSLLVAAKQADLLIVEQAVKQIDLPATAGDAAFQSQSATALRVHQISSGDLSKISQTLMAMVPGVMINEDARASALHVIANESKQQEVAALIRMLDGSGGGKEVAVVPLLSLDSNWAANTLNNMFAVEGTAAPVIQTDPFGQHLVVRGTGDQVLHVKGLIMQMSQSSGSSHLIPGYNSGPVRQIPLQGQDPAQLLPMLERLWRTGNDTPLRIIRPGDVSGQERPARPRSTPAATPASQPQAADESVQNSRSTAVESLVESAAVESPLETYVSQSQQVLQWVTGSPWPVLLQSELLPSGNETPAENAEQPAATSPETGKPETAAPAAGSGPAITVIGDRLVLSGTNEQELDALQNLLNSLMQQMASRTQWTIFYLQVAEAATTAEMLRQLFPDIEVAASTSAASSSLSRLGLMTRSTSSTPTTTTPAEVRIVPESRSNALFVSGPAERIRELEQVIKLLDSNELPETFRDRVARTIPVEYASVEDVAKILTEVYAHLLPQQTSRGGRPGEEAAISLTGGELSIGIDAQSSQVVVSCNESLFRQIEELVQSLDESARIARRTVRVVNLDYADAAAVQTTLGTLLPKVTFSTSNTSRVSTSRSSQTPTQTPSTDSRRGSSTSGRSWEGGSGSPAWRGSNRGGFGTSPSGRGSFRGGR